MQVFVLFTQSYEILYIYNILLTFSWICAAGSQWVKCAPLVLWHLAVAMVVYRIHRLLDSCVRTCMCAHI